LRNIHAISARLIIFYSDGSVNQNIISFHDLGSAHLICWVAKKVVHVFVTTRHDTRVVHVVSWRKCVSRWSCVSRRAARQAWYSTSWLYSVWNAWAR